jgi:putative intracellular protease/amidase
MDVQSSFLNNKALILLAPGFEQRTTICLLDHMREAGLSVSLVGLTAGLVKSDLGLVVRPDYSLEQLVNRAPYQLIIVPGGRQCTSSLVMDPRVHNLLEATLKNDGFVAATLTAEPLLTQMGIPAPLDSSRFISQKDMEVKEFTGALVNLLSDR